MGHIRGFDYLAWTGQASGRRLPRIALGRYPTPVRLHQTGVGGIFVKHDEATHERYGGNKLRKLEFLLGDAVASGRPYVATFGAAGSNHALATALHASAIGLRPLAFLSRQARSPLVGKTLEAHLRLGTQLVYAGVGEQRRAALRDTLRPLAGQTTVVPMGGSSWRGALGFIAAASELAVQIDGGELPVPARIVLPLGTMSTVIGLAMGLAACRLPTRVVAVRVVDARIANPARLRKLGRVWAMQIERRIPGFAADGWSDRIEIDDGQFGAGYARVTDASLAARRIAQEQLGLTLETTYSAKAFAAALPLVRGATGPTLFWNTYAGAVPALPVRRPSTTGLPPELAVYVSDSGGSGVSGG